MITSCTLRSREQAGIGQKALGSVEIPLVCSVLKTKCTNIDGEG